MKTSTKFSPSSKAKGMDDIVPIDDDGNEITHDAWGRSLKEGAAKAAGGGKNTVAVRLQNAFADMCEKYIRTKPVKDVKGYKIVVFALNSGGLTEDQIMKLFKDWFALGKSDEETISITKALSARQIEQFKIRNNIR